MCGDLTVWKVLNVLQDSLLPKISWLALQIAQPLIHLCVVVCDDFWLAAYLNMSSLKHSVLSAACLCRGRANHCSAAVPACYM